MAASAVGALDREAPKQERLTSSARPQCELTRSRVLSPQRAAQRATLDCQGLLGHMRSNPLGKLFFGDPTISQRQHLGNNFGVGGF